MKNARNTQARQKAILAQLQDTGRAMVDDLAQLFETTPQTIRKDLSALAQGNQIVRFHGGAALVAGTEYVRFDVRSEIARDEKEAIGRAVAARIPNNSLIVLNAGTTTAAVADALGLHIGLKVVTDSVNMANKLRELIGLEVIVPGGAVRGSDGAILGDAAVDFIRQFRADVAVIGAAAIAQDGALLDYDLREASVSRAIIQGARHVVLAADSLKYRQAAPVEFGHLRQIDTLVTDRACPPDLARLCEDSGTEIVKAG